MNNKTALRRRWEAEFLAAVSRGDSIKKAADGAGIAPSTTYSLRNTNARFAAEWNKATEASGRTPRSAGFTRTIQWKKPFLEALAETSNVSASAGRVNIPTATVYQLRRKDPAFARQWRAALLEGYEHLELETLHRLRAGTAKDDPRFDIANALRLLAMHKETVARERALQGEETEAEIIASINAKIAAMRAREREIEAQLEQESGRNAASENAAG